MNWDLLVQLAAPLSVLFAGLGVAVAVRGHERQVQAQLFLTLTERYENVMSSFPPDAFCARFASDHTMPPESDKLTMAVLRYLNLCSEEFYLWKNGYLPARLWRIWEHELRRTLNTPLFDREWPKLQQEFSSYSEFRSYVAAARREPLQQLAGRHGPANAMARV